MTYRDELYCQVKKIISDVAIGIDLEINGSWQRGDFHYDLTSHTSFSDIDLYANISNKEKAALEKKIRDEVQAESLLDMPVSIHTSRSLQKLEAESVYDLAFLEHLYVLLARKNERYLLYHKAKSCMVLLKNHHESFLDIKKRMQLPSIDCLYYLKIGQVNFVAPSHFEVVKCHLPNERLKYLFEELISSFCVEEAHMKSLYFSIIDKTSLSDYLLERIEQKLFSIGITWGS